MQFGVDRCCEDPEKLELLLERCKAARRRMELEVQKLTAEVFSEGTTQPGCGGLEELMGKKDA
jgi:hypothetical protein